jgi:hypothetical protein
VEYLAQQVASGKLPGVVAVPSCSTAASEAAFQGLAMSSLDQHPKVGAGGCAQGGPVLCRQVKPMHALELVAALCPIHHLGTFTRIATLARAPPTSRPSRHRAPMH